MASHAPLIAAVATLALLACVGVSAAATAAGTSFARPLTLAALENDPTRTSFSDAEVEALFEEWLSEFGMVFPAHEYRRRLRAFGNNLVLAGRLNALEDQNDPDRAVYGVTKFAHLSKAEVSSQMLMPKATYANVLADDMPTEFEGVGETTATPASIMVPDSFDWRDHSPPVVGSIDNEQQCGDTWAWAMLETISSKWALQTGDLIKLSVQQVSDCDKQSDGCNGGWPVSAINYAIKSGLESNASYPYKANNGNCKYDKSKVVVQPDGWEFATKDRNETAIAEYLYTNGPVSVSIDASHLYLYKRGILRQCQRLLDHCVQLTGYSAINTDKGYWVARQQWGTDWGIDGYFWMSYGNNTCGLADYPTGVLFGSSPTSGGSGMTGLNTGRVSGPSASTSFTSYSSTGSGYVTSMSGSGGSSTTSATSGGDGKRKD